MYVYICVQVLLEPVAPESTRHVFVLSDGHHMALQHFSHLLAHTKPCSTNSQQGRQGDHTMSLLGVGPAVDRNMLHTCARATRGHVSYITRTVDVEHLLRGGIKRALAPRVTEVGLYWGAKVRATQAPYHMRPMRLGLYTYLSIYLSIYIYT